MDEPTFDVGDILYHEDTGPKHDPDRPHHMIVAIKGDNVILVPICTWRKRYKSMPIVEATEVPGVLDHKSCLLMTQAMPTTIALILTRLKERTATKSATATADLLEKAIDALYTHPAVTARVRDRLPKGLRPSKRAPRRPTRELTTSSDGADRT